MTSSVDPAQWSEKKLFAWMQDVRRTLHRSPELSFAEINTAAYIETKLQEIGLVSPKRITETGIIVEIGSSDLGSCVGLRADIDALPIMEATELPFSSETAGVMHACGHDGHVAMLLGAAVHLLQMQLPGKVPFISTG